MKNNIMKFLSVIVFILGPVIISLAQPLPGSGAYATDPSLNGLPGAGAPYLQCTVPIGNGYWILLALAFGYGVYRIWQMRKAGKTA
jgi:hypothetical protein